MRPPLLPCCLAQVSSFPRASPKPGCQNAKNSLQKAAITYNRPVNGCRFAAQVLSANQTRAPYQTTEKHHLTSTLTIPTSTMNRYPDHHCLARHVPYHVRAAKQQSARRTYLSRGTAPYGAHASLPRQALRSGTFALGGAWASRVHGLPGGCVIYMTGRRRLKEQI